MTLNDYNLNTNKNSHILGDLVPYLTDDGSLSLESTYYKESFHSSNGARKEAIEKFILPSEINRFILPKEIRVLDLCFGLGYNSACLLEEIFKTSINLNWWGLEIDQRPITTALNNPNFKQSWEPSILEILESINNSGKWQNKANNGKVFWGDARKQISVIPKSIFFDLIFHDAFSPSKCPQLWSEEFLFKLSRRLAPNGRLITYSSSAAVRSSLKRAGLIIKSTIPLNNNEGKWSNGTVAILSDKRKRNKNNSKYWRELSEMEEEHLLTKAAIPYRDPDGNGSPREIIQRRILEQKKSNLSSTSSWRKRWKKLLSS
tara:strand:+ start:2507 stop:3457 length:951 start_codon:yes stop_codon:yes gene_type:complete